MNEIARTKAEAAVAKAFNKQSEVFDLIYEGNEIIRYKRARVREHVNRLIKPSSKILELNAGTGEDAIYFAGLGHTVHATDISEGMQNILREKVATNNLEARITWETCSFTQLEGLKDKGPYDLIFSNFAGLNCTDRLDQVFRSFSSLLRAGGVATLVILPGFCLWETLLLCKGRFRTAFRRFFSRRGRKAHIEGEYFTCWYHAPWSVKKHLQMDFEVLRMEGLCSLVPPSYIEKFGERNPASFRFLRELEDRWKTRWPWRSIGDYYIISFRKRS